MHNVAPCLTKTDVHGVAHPVAFHPTHDPISSDDGTTHSMGCGSSGGQASIAVAHPIPLNTMTMRGRPSDNGRMGCGIGEPGDPCPTLTKGNSHAVAYHMAVRRLTPTECERLQGFPDGYTAIPWRNKASTDCPDGPRYKALGNSWAVPVVRWIGERINKELGNE